jgi:flavin-dependent dehydrogenase
VEHCDLLIVGGGPAGSSVAWALRDSGLEVCILDSRTFPRDKPCAGWITPQLLEELAIQPEIYAKGRVLQPIRGFQVRRIGEAPSEVRSERAISYGIRRCEFDHWLLQRSEARLRLGEPLRRLERAGGRWIANGSIETPLVVGAGGHFCPVARRQSTAGPDREPVVAAREVEWLLEEPDRGDCPVRAEIPEIYFTADLKGYGWLFRKGDYLNVGLGRRDTRRFADHLAEFLDFLRAAGRLPRKLPGRLPGHAYLLYGDSSRRLVGENLALVGDAAGLAFPRSGEGIRPAVESALLLARSLRNAAGAPYRDALVAYERAMIRRFGRRGPRRRGLVGLLPAPLVSRAAGRLLANQRFARHVVVDRWFLHAADPPLASRAPSRDTPAGSAR